MAKLSAHGREVGRIVYTSYTKAYFQDGKVLKNYGDGWKLAGKLKSGLSPEQAYEDAKRRLSEWVRDNPCGNTFKRALHDIAPQSKRWKLYTAIQMMPDDCDGVWASACDGYGDNVDASVDEIAELCRLYLSAVAEAKEKKTATA